MKWDNFFDRLLILAIVLFAVVASICMAKEAFGSTLEDVQEYSVKQGVGCECLREICPEEEPCYCWYVCEDGSRFRVERSEG